MDDFEDNIFDDDPALDYIMSEEVENQDKGHGGKSGCLGVILIIATPVVLFSISSFVGLV